MLLTHRQTDKQTKSGKNITSLAEVIIFLVIPQTVRMLLIGGQRVMTTARLIKTVM